MGIQIDELIFQASIDTSSLDREIDRAVGRATNKFAALSLMKGIAPKVDLGGLHEFNRVMDRKIDHWGELTDAVKVPIRPRVDLAELEKGLVTAANAVDTLRLGIADVRSNISVSLSGASGVMAEIESLRQSVEFNVASIEVHADTRGAEEQIKDFRKRMDNPFRIKYDNSDAPDVLTRDVFGSSYRVKMYTDASDMRGLSREISSAVRDGMGGGFGDAVVNMLTSPVKAVKLMLSSVARGFFEEVGAGLSDGLGARRTARQQGARAGNFARTIDKELVGIDEVAPAFLSELTRSGSVRKATKYSAQYSKSTKVMNNLQRMGQVATFGDDPNQIVNIPELMELIPPEDLEELKKIGGKAYLAKKGGRNPVTQSINKRLETLLRELNPTTVVDNVVNPILAELSGTLALINKMQVHRAIGTAHKKADKLEPLFPDFRPGEKGLVNIIGGAQNRSGRGYQELATSFEPIIEGRKILGVANPQTDPGGTLPPGGVAAFIRDLALKTAPDLKTGPMAATLNNIALMVERTVNPLFEDSTVSDAIANSLVAKRKGIKDKDISTISYSLGGAPARDIATAYNSLGMGSNVAALAYPDLNAYKPHLPNFRAYQLEEDAISFPKTVLGIGSRANYRSYTGGIAKGSESHAYNHLFKSPELVDDFYSYLGLQNPGGDLPHVLNLNTNTNRSLGAAQHVKSLIQTGQFSETSTVGANETGMQMMQFVAEGLARKTVNEAGSPKQIAIAMAVREELENTYEMMSKHLEGMGLPAEHMTSPQELAAHIVMRAEAGGVNRSLKAMATGEGHGDDAWFAGGGDPTVVRTRIESAVKAGEHFTKLVGSTEPSAIKLRAAFDQLAKVMTEFAETGKLSAETIAGIQTLEFATNPELDKLATEKNPYPRVLFEEQRKYKDPNAQPWMYSSPPAVLAYNKMLKDVDEPSVIPPIEKIKIAAHGMSGATALITDDFVYKNDLNDADKIASKAEVASYKKLAGRYSPLMYHAEEGKLMVTERAKGTPLKDVLDEKAKPSIAAMATYQDAKKKYSEVRATEDQSEPEGLAKVKEAMDAMRAARKTFRSERKAFNKEASKIYEQVGTLGNTLQSMGVAHMDLAAGNVFVGDDGALSAIDLGNSVVNPTGMQEMQDELTTIQRAIIDTHFFGVLDIKQTIGAIRRGYKKKLADVPKRTGSIDDLPKFDANRDRGVELGSTQASELQEQVNYERFMPEATKLSAEGRAAKAKRDADKEAKARAAASAQLQAELEKWRSERNITPKGQRGTVADPWVDPFEVQQINPPPPAEAVSQLDLGLSIAAPLAEKAGQAAGVIAKKGATTIGAVAKITGRELVNAFQELYSAAKSIETTALKMIPLGEQTKGVLKNIVAPLLVAHSVAQLPGMAPVAELGAGAVKGLLDIPVSHFVEMPAAEALEAMKAVIPNVSIPGIGGTSAVAEALQTFLREQLASGANIITETVGSALAALMGGKTVITAAKTLGVAGVEKVLGAGAAGGDPNRNRLAGSTGDQIAGLFRENFSTTISPLIPPAPPANALPGGRPQLPPATQSMATEAERGRRLTREAFDTFKNKSLPLTTQRARATISSTELREIAIGYLQVKDYALRAIQSIDKSLVEIDRLIAATSDDRMIRELRGTKVKIAGLKGNISSYVVDKYGEEGQSYLGKRMKLIEQVPPEKLSEYDQMVQEIGGEAGKRGTVHPDILKSTKKYNKNDEGYSRKQALTAGALVSALAAIAAPLLGGGSIAAAGAGSIATATAVMGAIAPLAPAIGAAMLGAGTIAAGSKVVGMGVTKGVPAIRAVVTKIMDSIRARMQFGSTRFDRKLPVPRGPVEPPELDPAYSKDWGRYYDRQILGLPTAPPQASTGRPNFISAGSDFSSDMMKSAWIEFDRVPAGPSTAMPPAPSLMQRPVIESLSFDDDDDDKMLGDTQLKRGLRNALQQRGPLSLAQKIAATLGLMSKADEGGFGLVPDLAHLRKLRAGVVKSLVAGAKRAALGVAAGVASIATFVTPVYSPTDALLPDPLIKINPLQKSKDVSDPALSVEDTAKADARLLRLNKTKIDGLLNRRNLQRGGIDMTPSGVAKKLPRRDYFSAGRTPADAKPYLPWPIALFPLLSMPIASLFTSLVRGRKDVVEAEAETESEGFKINPLAPIAPSQMPKVNPLAPPAPSQMPKVNPLAAFLAGLREKVSRASAGMPNVGMLKKLAIGAALFSSVAVGSGAGGFIVTRAYIEGQEKAQAELVKKAEAESRVAGEKLFKGGMKTPAASISSTGPKALAAGPKAYAAGVASVVPSGSLSLSIGGDGGGVPSIKRADQPKNPLLSYVEEQKKKAGALSQARPLASIQQMFSEKTAELKSQFTEVMKQGATYKAAAVSMAQKAQGALMPSDALAALLGGGLIGLGKLFPRKGKDTKEEQPTSEKASGFKLPQLPQIPKLERLKKDIFGEKGFLGDGFFAGLNKRSPIEKGLDLGKAVDAGAETRLGRFYNTFKLLLGALGVTLSSGLLLGIAAGFATISKAALEAASAHELFQYQAANALGSRTKGEQLLRRSDKTANERGLALNTMRESNIQFQAATKDTPYEGEIAQFVADSISKAAVSRGLNGEQTQRATVGFLQAFGKEEIQPEEIRGQIAEAGFYDIQPVLARSLGVSTQSIDKLSRTNQLGTPELLKLVSTLNSDADGSGLDPGSTLNASFNRLGNSGQNFMEKFGASLKLAQPLIEAVAGTVNFLAGAFESADSIVGGAALAIGASILSIGVKSTITAVQASTAMGMMVNTFLLASRVIVGVLVPLALATAAVEAFSISINNIWGGSIFSDIAKDIEKGANKIKEAADTIRGIKPPTAPTKSEEEQKREALKGNWGQQGLDFITGNGSGFVANILGAKPGSVIKSQAQLNEEKARADLFGGIMPNTRSAIDSAQIVLAQDGKIKELAQLREEIAQNKIAQDRTDETPEGRAAFDRLKKEQGALEVRKLRAETPFSTAESTLEANKKKLQETIDKGATPDQKQALEGMIKEITVTQERFKTISSAVSELTRTFNRSTEALTRYDRSLSQSRARIAIQGSIDTERIYRKRMGADSDTQLQLDQKDQSVANDERSLAAIQSDLSRRTKVVADLKKLVGSDVVQLDPVKDAPAYNRVKELEGQIAKLKAQSTALAETGDSGDLASSFDVDSQALRLEQEADALRNSKSNLVYNAERLQKVKEAEDKILELQQEGADKAASIARGKVEKIIAIEQAATARLEQLYNLATIRDTTSAANYQSALVPIQPFEEKARLGFREAGVGVGIASQNLDRETQNRDALKGLIDSGEIKLTAKETRLAIAQADQKVAEAKKSLLEAEKAAVISMAALAAREIERVKARVDAINAQIDRDLAISSAKRTRAALTPVNLRESLLAVDISETSQKIAEVKNQQAALAAAQAQNANRYNSLQSTPENLSALTQVIGRSPGDASLQELMIAKDRYDALANKTPETEQQAATVNQLIDIQKEDVSIEQKKTELAKSANSLQLEIKTKMKEMANAQASLMKSIADETISINDSIRQAAAQLKQNSATNRLKESLLGVSGFMGEFVDSIIGLVEKINSIAEAEKEKVIQAGRSKLRFVGEQDKADQQRRQLVAETRAVFDGTGAVSGQLIPRQTTPTVVSIERDNPAYRDGETGTTPATGGVNRRVPSPADRLPVLVPQSVSSGYQVDATGESAARTVQQRTGEGEAVRAVLFNGQKIISTVSAEMVRYGTAVDQRRKVEADLSGQEIRAAVTAAENQTVKIIRDMQSTVISTQREAVAAMFSDRDVVRSSRRSNYQDQLEAARDEGLKAFLDAQNSVDDQIRSLDILLTNAKTAPEKLLDFVEKSALPDAEKGKIKDIVGQFGADSSQAVEYLTGAVASRRERRTTLPALYEGRTNQGLRDMAEARSLKVSDLTATSQAGILRAKAERPEVDRFGAAALTGQANLIEADSAYRRDLVALTKELEQAGLAGTEAGDAILANFGQLNTMKLDKIRTEINLLGREMESSLGNAFSDSIMSIGDVGADAFQRLLWPEKFTTEKWRSIGDGIIDVLKSLGSNVLRTMAKISADAAATSIGKWLQGGFSGFLNGILGLPSTPAASETPVVPAVETKKEVLSIPKSFETDPLAPLKELDVQRQTREPVPASVAAAREGLIRMEQDWAATQREENRARGVSDFIPVAPIGREMRTPQPQSVVESFPLPSSVLGVTSPVEMFPLPSSVLPPQRLSAITGDSNPAYQVDPSSNPNTWPIPPGASQATGTEIGTSFVETVRSADLFPDLPKGENLWNENKDPSQLFQVEPDKTQSLLDEEHPTVSIEGGALLGKDIATGLKDMMQTLGGGMARSVTGGGDVGANLMASGTNYLIGAGAKGLGNLAADAFKSIFGFADGGKMTDSEPVRIQQFAMGGKASNLVGGYDPDQINQAIAAEGNGLLAVVHPGEWMLSDRTGDAQLFESMLESGEWAERKSVSVPAFAVGGKGDGTPIRARGGSSSARDGDVYQDNSITIKLSGVSTESAKFGYNQDQIRLRQQRQSLRDR